MPQWTTNNKQHLQVRQESIDCVAPLHNHQQQKALSLSLLSRRACSSFVGFPASASQRSAHSSLCDIDCCSPPPRRPPIGFSAQGSQAPLPSTLSRHGFPRIMTEQCVRRSFFFCSQSGLVDRQVDLAFQPELPFVQITLWTWGHWDRRSIECGCKVQESQPRD